jgi:uncharacterized membrane protein HdeD (DUF308 family)
MLYLPREQGQPETESAVALAGIALIAIGILMLLAPVIANSFGGVVSNLKTLPP